MMPEPLLSVVIPSYNGWRLLPACLDSLRKHGPGDDRLEVIVADDASTDGTPWRVARAYPEVRVVARDANGGFVAAANSGIAAAQGRFIQLLNNDAEVTAGWLETGLEPFRDPRVGSVAPLVLMRGDTNRVDSAGDRFSLLGWPCKRGHGQPAQRWSQRPPDRIFGASASSAIYRAEALKRVGAFDPAFGSYYEDVDLAFRLRWAGYDCVHQPRCRVLHDVSATYDHRRAELQRRMSRNAELLFWTNLPRGWLALAILPHLAFATAQAAHRASRGRLGPFIDGKRDALKSWRTILERRRSRLHLAHGAVARPHFPVTLAAVGDLRNHIRRPV